MNELTTELTLFRRDGSHEVYHFTDDNYHDCITLRHRAENDPDVVYIADVTTVEILKELE